MYILAVMVKRSSKKKAARPALKHPAAVELGRLGGLKGGRSRAAKLTAEERREIARSGAQQRWSRVPRAIPTTEDPFEIQKRAFQKISPKVLGRYENQFVVSHNGRIVDSDGDLPTLTRRYFNRYPGRPAYITRIGGAAAIIGSPSAET